MARSDNAETVRAMWDAWRQEGIDAFLAIAPDDVEWRPSLTGGKPLWGSRDLRAMFESLELRGERMEATIEQIEELGEESVLVLGTMRRHGPSGIAEDQMAWLYCFRDGRLWRATAHHSAAEAREAARFAGGRLTPPDGRAAALTITEADENGVAVLAVRGELDLASAPLVKQALEHAGAPGATVRLDLGGIEFMDSTGMRAIIEATRQAAAGGWTLQLGRAPAAVQRVFSVSGIERLLPFDPPASA
jgi:anti-sigma B factor antagonist